MSTVICPHCGVTNRDGSNFCNNCGTTLRGEDTLSSAPAEQADAEHISKRAHVDPTSSDVQTPEPNETESSSTKSISTVQPESKNAEPLPQPPADRIQGRLPSEQPFENASPSTEEPPTVEFNLRSSLARGIPGLLEPQTIVGQAFDQPERTVATDGDLADVDLRRIRTLMTSEPRPSVVQHDADDASRPTMQVPWIFAFFGLALAIPIFLGLTGPTGVANELPGVEEAFSTIDQLDRPAVLLLWAYDPATAGELDLAVEPVLRHLEAKDNQILLASTLPFGPATARDMLSRVQDVALRTESNVEISLGYLPGGAAVLPLLGQERQAATAPDQVRNSALLDRNLDLVLIVSAQAEEVQHWLEQGQPLNQTRAIAVTSASADPYLRPYFDSKQLAGLVSGFDGGISYQRRLDQSTASELLSVPTATLPEQYFRQQIYQNWGHFAILALIVLGNFSMLNSRSQNRANRNRSSGSANAGDQIRG